MKKAVHVYAVNGKSNSGDFFLGPATKWKFENIIGEDIAWTNYDMRKVTTEKDIEFFNTFDYLILGGGGLLLPDTNPNSVSCWQWAIREELIKKIKPDIYVLSIGYNLFYGQTVCMPNRNSNQETPQRLEIFKGNMETLINQSKHFTMRHNGDCEELKKLVSENVHDKINFEFCPVLEYVKEKHHPSFKNDKIYHTFELKDDRINRRYHKKTQVKFYTQLLEYVYSLMRDGEKIAVMSHDGSRSFAHFLQQNGVPFAFLDNSVANEQKIINNYSVVKKLYCMAGHSQMTAHALGVDYFSLIAHDKLEYFLKDVGNYTPDKFYYVNSDESFLNM